MGTRLMANRAKTSEAEIWKWSDRYALIGTLIAIGYACYSFANKDFGDAIFGIVLAILSILTKTKIGTLSPNFIVAYPFIYSDRISRTLVTIGAVLGSALVVDVLYEISFFQWPLDTAVKRISAPILILNLTMFLSSLLRKSGYFDASSRAALFYKNSFFTGCIVACLSSLFFFVGLPIETYEVVFRDGARAEPELLSYSDDPSVARAYTAVALTSVIWICASTLCIIQYRAPRGEPSSLDPTP